MVMHNDGCFGAVLSEDLSPSATLFIDRSRQTVNWTVGVGIRLHMNQFYAAGTWS